MSDDILRQIDAILDSEHEKDPLARQLLLNAKLFQTIAALRTERDRYREALVKIRAESYEEGTRRVAREALPKEDDHE